MSKKKKIILTLSITVVVLGLATGLVFFLKNRTRNKKTVNVYPVESLGYTSDMIGNWDSTLSGNVVINKEQKIYLTSTDQVSEVKVQEGDVVKAGDVLLVYDTTAQSLQLETMRADVEIARTAVLAAERDLKILQNTTPVEPQPEEPTTEEPILEEPATENPPEEPTPEEPPEEPAPETPADDNPIPGDTPAEEQPQVSVTPKEVEQLSQSPVRNEGEIDTDMDMPDEKTYTKEELAQAIAEKQNEIKQLNIDYQLKQVELEILEYQTATGEVLCNFDGVVKTIADQETSILNNEPFIVVSGTDGYTVQGYIGELSLESVHEGDTVSMYSYDNGMTYTGVITEISDMPANGYYGYSSTEESFYPMTISVMDGDDLTQGMYMEITVDQSGTDSNSIYIPMALVDKENGAYYVMKEVDGKLQKVFIKTGKIVWGDTIEVQSGISFDDYLAIPYSKNAEEGVKTVEKSADTAYGF